MLKTIGIYVREFPRVSEAFIVEQASHLVGYRPTIFTSRLLKHSPLSSVALSEGDFLGLKQLIHLSTRSSIFFGSKEQLNHLSLIHAHFGPDGVYAMELADRLNIPFVVTFHGYDITTYRLPLWRTRKLFYYQLILHEKRLIQKAAAFIAVSRFIADRLLYHGYPQEKIIQHYIGVDTCRFKPSAKPNLERYIFCVGRHIQKKGIDTLLRAFARIASKHPDVLLIQVGEGPMSQQLRSLAVQLGVENRVRFLGSQPHGMVTQLMQGAEVFALPSQTADTGDSEALGIVFNEASACGLPIVSTWHGGIPEAVLDGKTGFLVPERDATVLAAKLDYLLANPGLGRIMGQRGREFVCKQFDIRKQTLQLEQIYNSVIHAV